MVASQSNQAFSADGSGPDAEGDVSAAVTDWVLNEVSPRDSVVYPGDALTGDQRVAMAGELVELCSKKAAQGKVDFRIRHGGRLYRVGVQTPQTGRMFFLRALSSEIEPLKPGRVPSGIVQQLLSRKLCEGGLVLVAGPPGTGKSTTVARTVAARLKGYGGVAWCLENPVEFELEGRHERGLCWQREVEQGHYGQAIREVMRCYPVAKPGILTIGEVRDRETADHCLTAAMNGLLVMATVHASSVEMTVERILNMSSERQREAFRATLASTLKCIVHQSRRSEGPVAFKSLWVNQPSSAYTAIRDGRSDMLRNDITFQTNVLKSGGDPVC